VRVSVEAGRHLAGIVFALITHHVVPLSAARLEHGSGDEVCVGVSDRVRDRAGCSSCSLQHGAADQVWVRVREGVRDRTQRSSCSADMSC